MTQYAYPTSDVENSGGWTTEPLWSKVDEEPYSDADYVQALQNAVNLAFTVELGSPNDPNVHTGHTLRIRAKCNVARAFKFELLQTSTVIHDSGSTNLTTSFAEYSFTLTEGEAANITNYAALRVRVTAITTYAGEYEQVSWMRLEVPDVVAIDLVPTEGYQTQASDSPALTQEHHLTPAEGTQAQVSDSPVLSTFIRGAISFADLLLLPEAERLVICEHKPAIEVETRVWGTTGETLWTNAGSTFNRGDFTATNAFFWCSLDLSAYAGTDLGSTPYSILLTDGTGKTARGFIGAVGAGETLATTGGPLNDGESFSDPGFADTVNWNESHASVVVSGGKLTLTATPNSEGVIQNDSAYMTNLALFKLGITIDSMTAGGIKIRWPMEVLPLMSSAATYVFYWTQNGTGNAEGVQANGTTSGVMDNITAKRVLDPPSTGVHIVSAYGGSVRAWASIDSGFNPNTIVTAVICGGVGIGSHYTPMTDGEIIEVAENGAAYDEVFTVEECNATASTFFMDIMNQRFYLHTSTGVIPSHQTAGVYDFCILAYFIIGFADRVDADGRDPVFEPEIETLLDGGFEDWTSETVPAHWTEA